MCKNCPNSDTCNKVGKRRFKLWELPSRFHCSIIGTCFRLDELRKIAKKFKVQPNGELTDYNLHGMFVSIASGQGNQKAIARHLSKKLDIKYFSNLTRVRGLEEERDLREYWAYAIEKGEVAGAFWALLTHPASSGAFREHLFGDVHMFSHLSGASIRIDLEKTAHLEKRIEELENEKEMALRRSRGTMAEKEVLIRTQAKQLDHLMRKEVLYEDAVNRLKWLEDVNNIRSQQIIIDELQRNLHDNDEKTAQMEKRLEQKERLATTLNNRMQKAQDALQKSQIECQALEAALARSLSGPSCVNDACPISEQGGDLDLCGRCIAFVGGRTNQTPHFKELVERHNGKFVHHDGGLENGQGKLEGILSKADAVLFPIDCVSHNASRDIKRFCKLGGKPFVPLPSSGLSTFTIGLQKAVRQIGEMNSES